MNISRLLRRCLLPGLLLLSAFSLLMFFLGHSAPALVGRLMLFPAACAALFLLLIAVPGRVRMPLLFSGSVLGIAAALRLFPGQPSMLAMPAGCAAALFFALSHADKSPAETSPFFYVITLAGQLAALFLHYTGTPRGSEPNALHVILHVFFVLYLLLLLLACSRISLNNATLSRYRLPHVISRVCTVMTVCFFALALLLASLPAVIAGVYAALNMLRQGMEQILLFIINLLADESTGGMQGGPMPMLPISAGFIDQEPSALALFLEKAAEILTLVVVIIGSLLLLRLLLRLAWKLGRLLLERLQHVGTAISEDYEDEITDTRQEENDRSFGLLRRRLSRRTVVYPDTPAGQIRRSYARLMRSHSQWSAGSTARENLPDSAASLYERARYSDHPLTSEDAGYFEQETRRL